MSLPHAGAYGAILVDAPWAFKTWSRDAIPARTALPHYETMSRQDIAALPVQQLAAKDCVLFTWVTWPTLPDGLAAIAAWGFTYKTCGFCWTKADVRQIEMFRDDADCDMLLGYWTRANTEPCLLATRGKPKRRDAGVRQAIVEPRRQHSRKPDCVHERIERLVAGPYLELFARQRRPGWDSWGDDVDKFAAVA